MKKQQLESHFRIQALGHNEKIRMTTKNSKLRIDTGSFSDVTRCDCFTGDEAIDCFVSFFRFRRSSFNFSFRFHCIDPRLANNRTIMDIFI